MPDISSTRKSLKAEEVFMKDIDYEIPKIIHCVWFGRKPYSSIVQYCMKSWNRYCTDYKVMIWNEDSFDIESNVWVKEAYEAKKWAFISDYIRLYALYNFGGVYIDSDVELLKPINELLDGIDALTGYEDGIWIPAAIMASKKHNAWIKLLLDYYDNRHFILENGEYDQKANTKIITGITKKNCGFRLGDKHIALGNVALLPSDTFQPYKKQQFNLNNIIDSDKIHSFYDIDPKVTYAIHHCTGTWYDYGDSFMAKVKAVMRKVLPRKIVENLRIIYYRLQRE